MGPADDVPLDDGVAMIGVSELNAARLAIDLARWKRQWAARGYRALRSPAIDGVTAQTFKRFGFDVIHSLTVLSMGAAEMSRIQATAPASEQVRALRWGVESLRATARVTQALAVDRAAFGDARCLDLAGWRDTLRATTQRRVWSVNRPREGLIGFAVCGMERDDGFLQRLAVHPQHQRQGVGSSLVREAALWVAGRRGRRLLVNTEPHNVAALQMYRSLGFRDQPEALVVMECPLTSSEQDDHR
jgi:ribosomal protein S18 acetylase RimI-like enzyme